MNMKPEEHVERAEEYVKRADGFVRTSEDQIYLGDIDAQAARIIDSLTRLATVHLQMASTKSLLESMPGRITSDLGAMVDELNTRSQEAMHAYGTVTGRLVSDSPPFQELDRKTKLPHGFTMQEWRAIKEYIYNHLEEENYVAHAVPGGNKFLFAKMVRTAELWAKMSRQRIEHVLDRDVPEGTEPFFKAWVVSTVEAPTNQYNETEAEVLGEDHSDCVPGEGLDHDCPNG